MSRSIFFISSATSASVLPLSDITFLRSAVVSTPPPSVSSDSKRVRSRCRSTEVRCVAIEWRTARSKRWFAA